MPSEAKHAGFLLLYVLLATDLFYMLLHVLSYLIIWFPKGPFWMMVDGSYPESFQYIKEFWIVMLLIYLAVIGKLRALFFWAIVFLWLMLDDALQIHEKVGGAAAAKFISQFLVLSKQEIYHYGQFVYSLGAGVVILVIAIVLYRYSDAQIRKIFINLFALLLLITFFGVGVDMVSYLITPIKTVLMLHIFNFVEEAGEHIAMSITLCYCFMLAISNRLFLNGANRSTTVSP